MKNIIPILWLIFILGACSDPKPKADPKVLMDIDNAFSDHSVSYGFHKAFIEFAHDSVVLLKPNQMPILGKQSLIDSYAGKSDSNVVLKWKPEKALMAQSGEMGYTYGFWTLTAKNDTAKGTYLTIWKKNAAGDWKFILDTGNQGLGK